MQFSRKALGILRRKELQRFVGMQRILAVCFELQIAVGAGEPFGLSIKEAGAKGGMETSRAAAWLKQLVAEGVLELVAKGGPRNQHPSRYRLTGKRLAV